MPIINKLALDNGLKVLHVEDKSTPLVAVNILYNVGAKDEKESHTGFAHLMEHLMFGGSINVPNFDDVMQNAGGENNAWTTNDITNFYDIVPKENVETAFYLEADRMYSLCFSEQSLKVQRQVVCEEFKQRNLNRPYGDVEELIREMAFKKHPYKWVTIGKELSHIQNTTMDDVKDWFFSHYAPNNAILSVVDNITFEEIKVLAHKWFSAIPVRKIAERAYLPEPVQTEPRRTRVERDVPNDLICKIYHAPNIKHKDYYTSDFLTDIFSYSKSSRLNKHLVMQKNKFIQIDSHIGSLDEEGLVYIKGIPEKNVSIEEAEHLILEEIEQFKNSTIEEKEMQKVRNGFESDKLYPATINDVAYDIAYYELLGDCELYNQRIEKHNSVKAEDIITLAKKIFVPENSSTLQYCKKS